MLQVFVEPLFGGFYGEKHREPNDEIDNDKDGREDQEHDGLKWDPGIDEVTACIGQIQGEKMEQEGFGNGPMLNLVKNTAACMNKGQKIGGYDANEHIRTTQRKILNREG